MALIPLRMCVWVTGYDAESHHLFLWEHVKLNPEQYERLIEIRDFPWDHNSPRVDLDSLSPLGFLLFSKRYKLLGFWRWTMSHNYQSSEQPTIISRTHVVIKLKELTLWGDILNLLNSVGVLPLTSVDPEFHPMFPLPLHFSPDCPLTFLNNVVMKHLYRCYTRNSATHANKLD